MQRAPASPASPAAPLPQFLWLHQGLKKAEIRSRDRKTVQRRFDERADTWVGPGLRLTVENIWSLSMFYRRSFALKVGEGHCCGRGWTPAGAL